MHGQIVNLHPGKTTGSTVGLPQEDKHCVDNNSAKRPADNKRHLFIQSINLEIIN